MAASGATVTLSRHPTPLPLVFFSSDEANADGTRTNPAVLSYVRSEWVAAQMRAREAEYTAYTPLRLAVGSWNVNGKWPKEDLAPWLTDGAAGGALPDVYVVGLQEMVDLTATNVALQSNCAKRTKEWTAMLEGVLNAAAAGRPGAAPAAAAAAAGPDGFECVGSRYLVGVMVAVFVKRRHLPAVSDVQDAVAAVGVMGVMGNKGAAAVRLRVHDSSFVFVCAHLAAHRNAVAQRNADFASIMAKTEFADADGRGDAAAVAARAGVAGVADAQLGVSTILDHDVVIFFGDFNYRIVETVGVDKCFELALGGEEGLAVLRRADQLNMERAAGRSFPGFAEAPLAFRPTYKFQVGTSAYETRAEKKLRAPAWCDRVLWRLGAGISPAHFSQLYYGSVDALTASDHKPVHALFEVAAKTTLRERKLAVAGEIARALDAMENASVPRVELSEPALAVEDVVYGVPSRRSLTLRNAGSVAAVWRFVPKPEEKVFGKTWLTLSPAYGMLPPGASVAVDVAVTVDDAVARDVSLGRELAMSTFVVGAPQPAPAGAAGAPPVGSVEAAGGLLEEILVLRVERGRDTYVPVTAAVLPTAFGCSLAQLARRPEPMRAVSLTAAAAAAVNAAAGAGPFAAANFAAAAPAGGGAGGGGSSTPRAPPPSADSSAGSRALAGALAGDEADVADSDAVKPDGSGSALTSLASSDASRKGAPVMAVPKEIWRLVDVLVSRPGGLDARGLFTAPGEPAQLALLRECLDTGDPIPAGVEPRAAAHCLLDLLSSLREPVVPVALFPGVATDARHVAAAPEYFTAHMLRALSPLHANVLVYIVRLGREVLARGAVNGAAVDDLALTLSRALMRKVAHDEAPAHVPAGGEAGAPGEGGAGAGAGAAGADSRGGDEGDDEGGATVALVGAYADRGTRWEPTRDEQDAMSRVMAYLLTTAVLT